jgi:Protein of unknown function (DUF3099)
MPHRHRLHHPEPVVQSVTTAPESLAQEQAGRIRRYLLTMAVRTTCFILAVVTAMAGAPAWVWGTMAVLALVLPYIAVVMANAVGPRAPESSVPVTPGEDEPRQLGS